MEIERHALEKEDDPATRERLEKLQAELAELREKSAAMKAHWQNEKETIAKIRQIKQRIEEAKVEEQAAERAGNLGRAAELRYGVQLSLSKELRRPRRG